MLLPMTVDDLKKSRFYPVYMIFDIPTEDSEMLRNKWMK